MNRVYKRGSARARTVRHPRRIASTLGLAMLVAIASAPSACSITLRADATQCQVDDDCKIRGGAFAASTCQLGFCRAPVAPTGEPPLDAGATDASSLGPLACLDDPTTPGAVSEWNANLLVFDPENLEGERLQDPTVNGGFYNPRIGTTAKLCSVLDVACARPYATAVTDSQGRAFFTIPPGASVYLELTRADLLPLLYYVRPLGGGVTNAHTNNLTTGQLTPSSFQLLASAGNAYTPDGFGPDAKYGHVLAFAGDCTGALMGGTSFTVDHPGSATVGFYLRDGLPSTTQKETDKGGVAGFVNLPTGSLTVTGDVAATGREIGSMSIFIRPGAVSLVAIWPSVWYRNYAVAGDRPRESSDR